MRDEICDVVSYYSQCRPSRPRNLGAQGLKTNNVLSVLFLFDVFASNTISNAQTKWK